MQSGLQGKGARAAYKTPLNIARPPTPHPCARSRAHAQIDQSLAGGGAAGAVHIQDMELADD